MVKYWDSTTKHSVLYLLHKFNNNADKYTLMKLMYFAELYHIENYGTPFLNDEFVALDYGPVPTMTYNVINDCSRSASPNDPFDVLGNTIVANQEFKMDELSESIIESLDFSFEKYGRMTFNQLKDLTHGKVWNSCFLAGKTKMNKLDIAREFIADDSVIEYLEDYLSVKSALAR